MRVVKVFIFACLLFLLPIISAAGADGSKSSSCELAAGVNVEVLWLTPNLVDAPIGNVYHDLHREKKMALQLFENLKAMYPKIGFILGEWTVDNLYEQCYLPYFDAGLEYYSKFTDNSEVLDDVLGFNFHDTTSSAEDHALLALRTAALDRVLPWTPMSNDKTNIRILVAFPRHGSVAPGTGPLKDDCSSRDPSAAEVGAAMKGRDINFIAAVHEGIGAVWTKYLEEMKVNGIVRVYPNDAQKVLDLLEADIDNIVCSLGSVQSVTTTVAPPAPAPCKFDPNVNVEVAWLMPNSVEKEILEPFNSIGPLSMATKVFQNLKNLYPKVGFAAGEWETVNSNERCFTMFTQGTTSMTDDIVRIEHAMTWYYPFGPGTYEKDRGLKALRTIVTGGDIPWTPITSSDKRKNIRIIVALPRDASFDGQDSVVDIFKGTCKDPNPTPMNVGGVMRMKDINFIVAAHSGISTVWSKYFDEMKVPGGFINYNNASDVIELVQAEIEKVVCSIAKPKTSST